MSNRIKEFRVKKGWTQTDLSRRSGVNRTTICYLESGRQKLKPTTAAKLALVLGCDPSDLMGSDVAQTLILSGDKRISLHAVLESIVDDISLRSVTRSGRAVVLSSERDRQLYRLLIGATRVGDDELRELADRASVLESDYLARTLGGED